MVCQILFRNAFGSDGIDKREIQLLCFIGQDNDMFSAITWTRHCESGIFQHCNVSRLKTSIREDSPLRINLIGGQILSGVLICPEKICGIAQKRSAG